VEQFHNAPWLGGLAVWTLIFMGGSIPVLGLPHSTFQNNSWKNFRKRGFRAESFSGPADGAGPFRLPVFLRPRRMETRSAGHVGGFAIFQSGSVLIGNGLGFMTGEWKGQRRKQEMARDGIIRFDRRHQSLCPSATP